MRYKPAAGSLKEAVARVKELAAANGEEITNAQAKKRYWADHPKPVKGEPLVELSRANIRAAIDAYAEANDVDMSEFTRAKLVGIARGYGDLTRTSLTPEEGRSIAAILAGLPSLGKKR